MLCELHIRDLGVIADATITPAPGMTAITGETGAGKTMIVSGLGLLLGGRGDAGIVRRGTDRALVEGRFTDVGVVSDLVDELGGQIDDGELLVVRQVNAKGRSRAAVGGTQVPLGRLSEVTGELATIHGQAEQIRLGTSARQREVLDRAGGPRLAAVLAEYREAHARHQELVARRDLLAATARERAQRADLLRFGLDEIAALNPTPDEEEALTLEARRLQAVDELLGLASDAAHALVGAEDGSPEDPGALGLVGMARRFVDQIARTDESQQALSAELAQALSGLNDLAMRLIDYRDSLEADPQQLETVMARRSALHGLTRKYGATLVEVLAWAASAREELAGLVDDDATIAGLEERIAQTAQKVSQLGGRLTDLRRAAADSLTRQVASELTALAMPHARLEFRLEPTDTPTPWGLEQVHVLFAANPGATLMPLGRVASGGELSRVRLALEVVLAADDPGHVFIFDEVDAGVGGAVGTEIGRRLARLARTSQVIVVTHLAQVAAWAQSHWVVQKSSSGEVTTSDLRQVSGIEREAEIARMMGGLLDSTHGLEHARELLAQAVIH